MVYSVSELGSEQRQMRINGTWYFTRKVIWRFKQEIEISYDERIVCNFAPIRKIKWKSVRSIVYMRMIIHDNMNDIIEVKFSISSYWNLSNKNKNNTKRNMSDPRVRT